MAPLAWYYGTAHEEFIAVSERITQAELARRVALTPGRISQLKRQGLPVGDDGRVDLDEALGWLKKHLDPSRRQAAKEGKPPAARPAKPAEPDTPAEEGDLTEARTRLEWLKVQKLELELAVTRSELVPLADVQAALFGFARLHRDRWQGWVSGAVIGMAGRLGIEPAALFAELDKGVREHLAELANLPAPRLGNADAD